jgi:hypothetical protein
MILKEGTHVQVMLRTSLLIEGIVISWSDDEYSIRLMDGKKITHFMSPFNDIILIQEILEKSKEEIIDAIIEDIVIENVLIEEIIEEPIRVTESTFPPFISPLQEKILEVDKSFKKVVDEPCEDIDLKVKKISELKIMQNQLERQEAAEKMNSQVPSQFKVTNYEFPNFKK